jgi:hypothetical protein
MINKENLTDYIHKKMNYKKEVEVTSFKVYNNLISVNLNKTLGENFNMGAIKKQKFLNWLHQNRNQKIEEIIGEYHD